MTVPNIYGSGSEAPNVQYSFQELASGLAISTLFLGDVEGGYSLSTIPFYAKTGFQIVPAASTLDISFSLTVNLPILVLGTSIVNIPIMLYNTGGGAHTPTRTVTVTLRRGSTDIATGNMVVSGTSLNAGSKRKQDVAIKLNVTTAEKFSPADTLTLRIQMTTDTGTVTDWYLIHDPANRAGNDLDGAIDNAANDFTAAALHLSIKADL